jgi:hypothetical protein
MATRVVEVAFPDGRVALTAFWGYLARGGLVLFGHRGLREGEPIALDVRIAHHHTALAGVVVRAEPAGPTVVAFADDAESAGFLRAAFAGHPAGCTIDLPDDGDAPVGAHVELDRPDGRVGGDVIWARGRERGVLFDDEP